MDTKKLRQKILDLAIRGKLVPQNPNDEPASVLLERIRAEKERLIAEGKIKRPKKSKSSSFESHYPQFTPPFEIPDSWEWVKLGEIGDIVTGNTPAKEKTEYYNGNIPFYKPTDLEQGIDTKNSLDHLSEIGYRQSRQLPQNSILVTCIGATIGKTGLIKEAGSCNQQINAIIPHKEILPEYIYFYCISEFFQTLIIKNASATTLPILNKGIFEMLQIPIPPYREQQQIIDTIGQLIGKIDFIETSIDEVSAAIDRTKSKILDLAMQGKLVPQDSTDEPAADMLRRINPNAKIITDNPHYPQLPDNWILTTIGEAFKINPKNKVSDTTTAGFVPMNAIQDGFSDSFIYEERDWKDIKSGFTHFANGDVAVAKISPCLENRKSMILRNLPNGIGAGTTELLIFRSEILLPEFSLLFFKSNFFINSCTRTFNGVVGQQRVGKNIVEEIAIPIPPVSTQKKIINIVKQWFILLDKIRVSLLN